MRSFFILLFTFSISICLQAEITLFSIKQDYFTKFESLTEKDGLPGKEVHDIIQDSTGFMWFATDNGLARYDGYNFINYQKLADDSSSISNNMITCLAIDRKGNLWVGTENGLNLFNRNTESFTSFHKSIENLNSINDNHIKALYADNKDNLWMESAKGVLHKIDLNSLEIKKYKHRKPHQTYYRYHAIYEDLKGDLWIGGRGIPVTKFDRETETFVYDEADNTNSDKKRDNDIACYFEDSKHNFWVSATDGAYLMNRENGIFNKVLKSSTFTIIEDQEGQLWLGSSIGLLRKDTASNTFKNFRQNQDNPYSITDNHIHKLYEDRTGVIWIATADGVSKYSPKKNKFKNYRHIANIQNSLSGNNVTSIVEDNLRQIWVSTQLNGLNKLNPLSGEITRYKSNGNVKSGLSSNKISNLYKDYDGNLWIGLWAGVGFNKLNPRTETFSHYALDPYTKKRDWYNDFLELRDGRFYCGIWGAFGFMRFNRKNEDFADIQYLNTSRPKYSDIAAIQFIDGSVYLGSNTHRLYEFNIQNEDFTSYHTRVGNPKKTNFPFGKTVKNIDVIFKEIKDLFTYQNKILLAASDNGLLIQNIKDKSFRVISRSTNKALLSNKLNSFFEYSSDTLCLISDKGLNFFSLKNDQLLTYSVKLKESPITILNVSDYLFLIYSDKIIKFNLADKKIVDEYYLNEEYKEVKFQCAIDYKDQQIILGTNRGACVFDTDKGTIIQFIDKSYQNMQNWFSVNALFRDQQGVLWVGTDVGFGEIDLLDDAIKWVRDSSGKLDRILKGNVQCFTEDANGNLWIGTEMGACIYSKNAKQIEHLSSFGEYGMSSHLINVLFEDQKGNIWVGTSDAGLNVMLKDGDIMHYPGDEFDPSGYRGVDVKTIFQDSKMNIWVGGNRGLNKFEGLEHVVKNFTTQDGFPHLAIKGILEDDDNNLWISTANGISQFSLETEKIIKTFDQLDGLQDNNYSYASCKLQNGNLMFGGSQGITVIDPRNVVNEVDVPVIAFTAINKHNELAKTEVFSGDTITVTYATKFFSVEFSVLDFTEPQKNKYRYKLVGSFDDWIELENEHKVSFTNLASGRYELKIIGADYEGHWNEKGIYLVLMIKPPFWRTWWFISLGVLIVLSVAFTIMILKINSLEKEKKNLRLEQRLLRTQMNPHFIFNVLAAVQGLIYNKETKTVISYLSKFAALMRSILYHSREENIVLEDEIKFIDNYLKLQQLRFSERFDYEINTSPSINPMEISIPPMLLQPFIENSIEHGLNRKTEIKGKVLISFKKMGNDLLIVIEDNGIGIDHSKTSKKAKESTHKSLGITTTLERIQRLNKGKNSEENYKIIDLGTNKANQSGTKVVFKIPFQEIY